MGQSASRYRLISPATLAALGDLDLIARTVLDGFMYGAHPSRTPGAGVEFSQFRSYQPGDDLRRIDWKLFGRSDRYYVRESESETSVAVQIVLDASGSMTQSDSGLSKFDYGRFLSAALAVLAHRQGDAIGLHLPGRGTAESLPVARGQRHLNRLLHVLEEARPGGAWPAWSGLEGPLVAPGRAVTLFITDLHERVEEIRTAARHLAALRHDVAVVHLVSRAELEFSWSGAATFEELETGATIEVDADAARAAYLAAVAGEQRQLEDEFAEASIAYARTATDAPLDESLRRFLALRARA